MIKSTHREIIPYLLPDRYKVLKIAKKQRLNLRLSIEEEFTNGYLNDEWGREKGELNSGQDAANSNSASSYVAAVSYRIRAMARDDLVFIDLGCGDFRIGKQLVPLCEKYIGVAVVKPLVASNSARYEDENVKFLHLDIITIALPAGDVCFLRQVLQHLSNDEILHILRKLRTYWYIFVTEHYPPDRAMPNPNLDKEHSSDIRMHSNSGVYLDAQPLRLASNALECALSVDADGNDVPSDAGVFRTFLYTPGLA